MTHQNPYTGDVLLTHGPHTLTLRYDWAALARVQEEVGFEALSNLLRAPLSQLACVAAAGLAHHHPDVATKEAVMALNIPIMVVAEAAAKAINFAYFGPGDTPKEDKDAGEDKKEGKKTL